MAKLYPPVIEGTIPAFYGDEIIVPYSMNKSVNKDEIAGFSLKIKTVQNNLYLGTLEESSFTSNEVRFPINNLKLKLWINLWLFLFYKHCYRFTIIRV